METNRLYIRRFGAQYLVSAQHPAPQQVKARLDDTVTQRLAPTLCTVCSAWFADTDPSLWLIRRLEIEVAVNAAWDRDQLARSIATQLVRTLDATLQDGADHDNIRRFPNRAAYLASFLTDLAAGEAWGRWYYEAFAGLRLLPVSAALRTAICDAPETGREALWQLTRDALQQVLRALTAQDARQILDHLAATAAPGDAWQCCQVVWEAWQTVAADVGDTADEWRQALHLYIIASRAQEQPGGQHLHSAVRALLLLVRRLTTAPMEHTQQLRAVLTGGAMAALYTTQGAADAETLLPLLYCPPAWVCEVVQTLMARQAGPAPDTTITTPGRRDTPYGGVFLLLPLLDQWPLAEATRGWPHADEAAAISLVRFLVLVKCCGQQHAHRAFYDPLLRDLLLVPPALSPASIADWQARISTAHLQTFLATLAAWHGERGTVAGETLLLVRSALRGEPVAVLSDSARGIWLHAAGYPRHRARLIAMLRDLLARSAQEPPVLLCDHAFLPALRSALPALQIISLDDATVNTMAQADHRLAELIARLDRLTGDVVYLSLPRSYGMARGLDRAVSVAAQGLLRNFAWRLPGFAGSHLPYLCRNFLDFAGSVEEESARRVVRLGRPPLHLVLNMTGMARHTYQLSWLDERPLALFQEG
jgi:hypothetical protein